MNNLYQAWDISDERRLEYAKSSKLSQLARLKADALAASLPDVSINPKYKPENDMEQLDYTDLKMLSLFSGGGGLDLGFDRAGFSHLQSYELLDFAGKTIKNNRPNWNVSCGVEGDVTRVRWSEFKNKVAILHGGPPCQPFSIAGKRNGKFDPRDMVPEFVRAVRQVNPTVFLMENVVGFMSKKFSEYREKQFAHLERTYNISIEILSSAAFGVPQNRRRVFCIGVKKELGRTFEFSKITPNLENRTVRHALALKDIGYDTYAPTLRCTLTGPRQTTSIANSQASVVSWKKLGIWPHGVSPDRKTASQFPTKDNTYRLCVQECQILQGFPLSWDFEGPVYKRLGMIGNSVSPPMAYAIAKSIRHQIFND